MDIIAQVAGFIGLLFLIKAIQNNKKELVLRNQIFANVFYELQYISLGAVSGAFMAAVALIRSIIFNSYEHQNKKIPKKILIGFWIIIIGLGIVSYSGYLSLIPIIATVLYTYAIWQNDLKKFRLLSVFAVSGWVYYNIMVGAYIGSIGSIIELLSIMLAIDKFDGNHLKSKSKKK